MSECVVSRASGAVVRGLRLEPHGRLASDRRLGEAWDLARDDAEPAVRGLERHAHRISDVRRSVRELDADLNGIRDGRRAAVPELGRSRLILDELLERSAGARVPVDDGPAGAL